MKLTAKEKFMAFRQKGKPCKNFKRYKGVRKPTCGCDACMRIWLRQECQRDALRERDKACKAEKRT